MKTEESNDEYESWQRQKKLGVMIDEFNQKYMDNGRNLTKTEAAPIFCDIFVELMNIGKLKSSENSKVLEFFLPAVGTVEIQTTKNKSTDSNKFNIHITIEPPER